MQGQKPNLDEYTAEVLDQLGFKGQMAKAENVYEINMRSARAALGEDPAFLSVVATLRGLPETYLTGDPELLFYPADFPDDLRLKIKPFGSVMEKLHRRNVLHNKKWPAPPPKGALPAERIYVDVDDLLRTRLVCRYLDGPKYVCEQLKAFCDTKGIESNYRELSTDAGYYAWHFYFRVPAVILLAGAAEKQEIWVEIQFTTQLAEVITSLTHALYQSRRADGELIKHWKWIAASPQFRSAFLGHGLHLLEGMIQSFRDDVFKARVLEPAEAAQESGADDALPEESKAEGNK